MKYRLNICEKHYGTAVVDANSHSAAIEMAPYTIANGSVYWTNTELHSVSAELEGNSLNLQCPNCGHNFMWGSANCDELGWHTSCPICQGSFDIDLPNGSEHLQEHFDYCRVDTVINEKGYLTTRYHCDPELFGSDTYDTVDSCNLCRKQGCHIHTAAQDAEMFLNGEKEGVSISSCWRNNADKEEESYIKGFTCLSRMEYGDICLSNSRRSPEYIDQIMYGLYLESDGCKAEMAMRWYDIKGELMPCMEVFSDAFILMQDTSQEVLNAIHRFGKLNFTPDEFSRLLLQLGYTDMSDQKLKQTK